MVDVDVVLLLLDVVVPAVVVLEVVMVVIVVMVVVVVTVVVDFNLKAGVVVCLEGRNVGLYFGVAENIVLKTGEYDQAGLVGGGRMGVCGIRCGTAVKTQGPSEITKFLSA